MGNPTIDFDYSMTKNKITWTEIKYDHKKYLWFIHSNTNISIKNQIEDTIEKIYLDLIFDIMGGLANKFALDVIRVFYASYREIDNTDMKTAMSLWWLHTIRIDLLRYSQTK